MSKPISILALLIWALIPARAYSQIQCPPSLAAAPITAVEIDGISRSFILALPENYQPGDTHPLIFAFHGRTDTNAKVRSYFDLEAANDINAIIVYPAATRDKKKHNHWWRRGDKGDSLRDYELFDKILASVADQYCVDRSEIYVIGHSLGASFANSLACARADQIRALISVAGGIQRLECNGKVAAMLIHNPKDELVKIANGERARDLFLKANQLTEPPRPSEPQSLNCVRYGGQNEANPVLWCAHNQDYNNRKRYYPHNWPSETATNIFAFIRSLKSSDNTIN